MLSISNIIKIFIQEIVISLRAIGNTFLVKCVTFKIDVWLGTLYIQVQGTEVQVSQKTSAITVVLEFYSAIGPMFLQFMRNPAT